MQAFQTELGVNLILLIILCTNPMCNSGCRFGLGTHSVNSPKKTKKEYQFQYVFLKSHTSCSTRHNITRTPV